VIESDLHVDPDINPDVSQSPAECEVFAKVDGLTSFLNDHRHEERDHAVGFVRSAMRELTGFGYHFVGAAADEQHASRSVDRFLEGSIVAEMQGFTRINVHLHSQLSKPLLCVDTGNNQGFLRLAVWFAVRLAVRFTAYLAVRLAVRLTVWFASASSENVGQRPTPKSIDLVGIKYDIGIDPQRLRETLRKRLLAKSIAEQPKDRQTG